MASYLVLFIKIMNEALKKQVGWISQKKRVPMYETPL